MRNSPADPHSPLDLTYGSIGDDAASGGNKDESLHSQASEGGGAGGNGSELTALLPGDQRGGAKPPLVPLSEDALSKLGGSGEKEKESGSGGRGGFLLYLVYGSINIIMCVPCLYGYASVIFNNDAFQPHINGLSKLVLWSSVVHQCCFSYFSSLPFSIGQVQDAGLIFLSHMANQMANDIRAEGGTDAEIVSTAIVVLGIATATLGLVLVVMGRYRLADAVAYLPLPVVGGYLAFIGYFCFEAGVALCVSESIMELPDWKKVFNGHSLLLALPGVVAGFAILWTARNVRSDAALPIVMVSIPALFYIVIYSVGGYGLKGAREDGWVGEESPPIPPRDVFSLVEFGHVHWKYIVKVIPTWAGMVFVVSFSSCLDVAAIAMDMGEALDTNNELTTVGISNVVSGLLCGFTGSYIFSQTIFTYRTGCNSRWVGIITAIGEMAVFLCTVNILEVAPLFFLGATLIFIGLDLMYEWLVEVRHKLLLSEYIVLVITFVAIQVAGIDAGIIFGIVIAIVDYVVTTAKVSTLSRVSKRSRAVWRTEDWKLLQEHGYHIQNPQIVTLEIKGSVFFGSSLKLLQSITDELTIKTTSSDRLDMSLVSPRVPRMTSMRAPHGTINCLDEAMPVVKKEGNNKRGTSSKVPRRSSSGKLTTQPLFVVLDMSQMSNLDASAARGCFLQLARMCEKRGMVLCAAGANPRVDWTLRSHDVAYTEDEEGEAKDRMQCSPIRNGTTPTANTKLLLFHTLYEALEFCENKLIQKLDSGYQTKRPGGSLMRKKYTESGSDLPKQSLSSVFNRYLHLDVRDTDTMKRFEASQDQAFHEELDLRSGDVAFSIGDSSDSFFVVLAGSVAAFMGDDQAPTPKRHILSGGGLLRRDDKRKSFAEKSGELGQVKKYFNVGGIFGFVDFILDQPKTFTAVAAQDGTIVAKLSRSGLNRLKTEDAELERIVEKVLLQASALELANVAEP